MIKATMMELTMSSSLRVNRNPQVKFHYFGKSCFIPIKPPSVLRLPNHDLLSSSTAITSPKIGPTTSAASSRYKISCKNKAAYGSDVCDSDPYGYIYEYDAGILSHDIRIFHEKLSSLIRSHVLLQLRVMVRWLLRLSCIPQIMKATCLSRESQIFLKNLADHEVTEKDYMEIMKLLTDFEENGRENARKNKTYTGESFYANRGIDCVKTFLKEKCKSDPSMDKMFEFFDLSCSYDDINRLVESLMVQELKNLIILPTMHHLIVDIRCLAEKSACFPINGRPKTTMGAEIYKFANRLEDVHQEIEKVGLVGCFGTENIAAISDVDLEDIAIEFVISLGICPYSDPYEFPSSIISFNEVLREFAREFLKGMKIHSAGLPDGRRVRDITNRFRHTIWFSHTRQEFRKRSRSVFMITNEGMCVSSFFTYLETQAGIRTLNTVLEDSLAKTVLGAMWTFEVSCDLKYFEKLEELKENGKLGSQEGITEFIEGLDIPPSTKNSLLNMTLPHICGNVLGL